MCNFYLCCKFLKWFNLFVFSFWVVLKNITSAPSTTSVPIPTLQQCSEVPISTNVIYHKLCTIILPYYNTISVFFVQPDVDSNIRSLTFWSTSSPLGLNAIAANFLLFIARLLSLSHSLALIPFGKKKKKKTWFPVRTAHSWEFPSNFCVVSCKTSQNGNLLQLLNKVISKFQNNCHIYGCKAVKTLCFILSRVTWWNNFTAVKINKAVGKRIQKALEIVKVCGL